MLSVARSSRVPGCFAKHQSAEVVRPAALDDKAEAMAELSKHQTCEEFRQPCGRHNRMDRSGKVRLLLEAATKQWRSATSARPQLCAGEGVVLRRERLRLHRAHVLSGFVDGFR